MKPAHAPKDGPNLSDELVYQEGRSAFDCDMKESECPYDVTTAMGRIWIQGWWDEWKERTGAKP